MYVMVVTINIIGTPFVHNVIDFVLLKSWESKEALVFSLQSLSESQGSGHGMNTS